jgi:hypothetical protein
MREQRFLAGPRLVHDRTIFRDDVVKWAKVGAALPKAAKRSASYQNRAPTRGSEALDRGDRDAGGPTV